MNDFDVTEYNLGVQIIGAALTSRVVPEIGKTASDGN